MLIFGVVGDLHRQAVLRTAINRAGYGIVFCAPAGYISPAYQTLADGMLREPLDPDVVRIAVEALVPTRAAFSFGMKSER